MLGKEFIKIRDIGNSYGTLKVCYFEGKYYWSLENSFGDQWKEIPASLYVQLVDHENKLDKIWIDKFEYEPQDSSACGYIVEHDGMYSYFDYDTDSEELIVLDYANYKIKINKVKEDYIKHLILKKIELAGYMKEYSERCKPRAGTIDAPEPLNITKKRLCGDIKILRKDGTEIGSYDK